MNPAPATSPVFMTTHWSVVVAAGRQESSEADAALEHLCRSYWHPLYGYLRRRGFNPEDAKDLAQGFFARFLAKNYLADVDRDKGKFRSFLLASMNNFLANEWDRASTQKRGGGHIVLSLDDDRSEERYAREPAGSETLDTLFDRCWALTILERALAALKKEFESAGKAQQFDQLKRFLTAVGAEADYSPVAAELQMKPGTIAVTVHRMRQRYRELVRAEIAQTVTNPADQEEEMRYLLTVLTAH